MNLKHINSPLTISMTFAIRERDGLGAVTVAGAEDGG